MTVIGIDVSKNWLDVYIDSSGDYSKTRNHDDEFLEMVARFASLNPTCIVLEATGGYERPVKEELEAAGLPVVRVNPRQVRDFARACGQLAKTDKLDAKLLATFGKTIPLAQPSVKADETLKALVQRRQQLTEQLVRENNQLKQARNDFIVSDCQASICHIQERLKVLIPFSVLNDG